jgi:hypothetical protein
MNIRICFAFICSLIFFDTENPLTFLIRFANPSSYSMKRHYQILLVFLVASFFYSCSSDDEVAIPDNAPPPDQTIENVTISNYVNRVYVSVLGREADSNEKNSGFNLLRQNNLSMSSRMQFLDQVFLESEYLPHLYEFARIELLNNLDTSEVTNFINIFTYLLADTNYAQVYDILEFEIDRLDSLRNIPPDLSNNVIGVEYMHRRCINNYFYDQINMGSQNFVVSTFQHFLNRYPTETELNQGKNMVDGTPAILFLESGQSKEDYLDIFFTSEDYYEGLAVNLYQRFLLRNPTSVEMGNAVQAFVSTHDFTQMQKSILATNEYIGIE